jgi:putative heme iron utilization protein
LPSGVQVVSSLSAKDGPRSSTTTMITSRRSVTDLRDHFAAGLAEAGYGNVRMQEIQRSGAIERAQLVTGQRGGEIVEVVIFDQHGTTAVINQGQAL